MEPAHPLLQHLTQARVVYGCLDSLGDGLIFEKLSTLPCLIIVQNQDWQKEPWSKLAEKYQKLKPLAFSHFKYLEPHLSCTIRDYPDKAVRGVGLVNDSYLTEKFLIIEEQHFVGIWNENLKEVYTDDLEVVLEYRKHFFTFLCLSGELGDRWQPGQYYELFEPHRNLTEYRPLAEPSEPSDSISLSNLPEVPRESYYQMFGKILYYGVKFALEVNFSGCSRCGRKSHTSFGCYAKRDISGRWLK